VGREALCRVHVRARLPAAAARPGCYGSWVSESENSERHIDAIELTSFCRASAPS
jgi:hypothetical protein